ncbi:MAG TPA: hypothetical protein VIE65_17395 [Methylobacter sp.]
MFESDRIYLKCLEFGPFQPIGYLYNSVFANLAGVGFCDYSNDGYILTDIGRSILEPFDGINDEQIIALAPAMNY